MSYALEDVAVDLKEARERKSLSQRDLSALAGIPQGQISRIEKGVVDLRVSSLIELARALDLEVLLVPRKSVPAVKSIVRSNEPSRTHPTIAERQRWAKVLADRIPHNGDQSDYGRIQDLLRWIQHYPVPPSTANELRGWLKSLENNQVSAAEVWKSLSNIRNRLAHGISEDTGQLNPSKPAYSLDENDDA